MLALTAHIVFSAFMIEAVGRLVRGVEVDGASGALVVASLVGLANGCVRPALVASHIPLTVLTLGLSLFVVNALVLGLVSAVFPAIRVRGLRSAFVAALALGLVNLPIAMVLGGWEPDPDTDHHVQWQIRPGQLCCAPSAVAGTMYSFEGRADGLREGRANPG